VKWENAFDAFAGFAKNLFQPSRPEDDVAIAPQGNEGQTMVLRMMVGDGVRPREEGRVRPPDIQGRVMAGSDPRIFRAGGGRRP
jgi:hypothetical protein